MRFGPAGYPLEERTPLGALDTVRNLGLDALEMEFVRGVNISEAKAKEIGLIAKSKDIRLSAHAPYFISFNSDKEESRKNSIDYVMDTVRAAHNLGAYLIVIHAASYGRSPKTATDNVIKGLLKCSELMDDEKINDVVLGIETMGKKGTWGTLDEISEVMDNVPNTHPVLDVAHVHARNGGCLRSEKHMKDITDIFFKLSGEIAHFHISCVKYGDKGEISHLPLAVRDPDMQYLANVLRDVKKDCTFICESPLREKDALFFKYMFDR
ncbi:MAG: TIM barrel protein [archaeon]|nr:TIM barrel protein [archaeon]